MTISTRTSQRLGLHPAAWVTMNYVVAAVPLAVMRLIMMAQFRDADLLGIGALEATLPALVAAFLAAPLLDAFGCKRQWLSGSSLAIAVMTLSLLLLAGTATLGATLALLLVSVGGIYTVAADGYYLEALEQPQDAKWLGFRAVGYEAAVIGIAQMGLSFEWDLKIAAIGVVPLMGLLAILQLRYLPPSKPARRSYRALIREGLRPRTLWLGIRIIFGGYWFAYTAAKLFEYTLESSTPGTLTWEVIGFVQKAHDLSPDAKLSLLVLVFLITGALIWPGTRGEERPMGSSYLGVFARFWSHPKCIRILAFVAVFPIAQVALMHAQPQLLRDAGLSAETIATTLGVLGWGCNILGVLVGGYWIARVGVGRAFWPLALGHLCTSLAYLGALKTGFGPDVATVLQGIVGVQAVGAGMSHALVLMILIRACKPADAAAHMAIAMTLIGTSAAIFQWAT